MRYINNRAQFTIAELQAEFSISRSTAIRDIQEIEMLGFPLVVERGRGGGYSVLQNHYLPSIRFTADELRAILISFLASRNSQLPFLQNRRAISEKLIGIAGLTQQDELIGLSDLLLFENTNPANPNLLELDDAAPSELNQLIKLAARDRHLQLSYELAPMFVSQLEVQVLHIFNSNSLWYLEVFDFGDNQFKNLPIAQLRDSQALTNEAPLSAEEIRSRRLASQRQANLVVTLGSKAISRFKRLHPPGLVLEYTAIYQSQAIFHTQLDLSDGEQLDSFADWLLFLGDDLHFDKIPDKLRDTLKSKAKALLNYI